MDKSSKKARVTALKKLQRGTVMVMVAVLAPILILIASFVTFLLFNSRVQFDTINESKGLALSALQAYGEHFCDLPSIPSSAQVKACHDAKFQAAMDAISEIIGDSGHIFNGFQVVARPYSLPNPVPQRLYVQSGKYIGKAPGDGSDPCNGNYPCFGAFPPPSGGVGVGQAGGGAVNFANAIYIQGRVNNNNDSRFKFALRSFFGGNSDPYINFSGMARVVPKAIAFLGDLSLSISDATHLSYDRIRSSTATDGSNPWITSGNWFSPHAGGPVATADYIVQPSYLAFKADESTGVPLQTSAGVGELTNHWNLMRNTRADIPVADLSKPFIHSKDSYASIRSYNESLEAYAAYPSSLRYFHVDPADSPYVADRPLADIEGDQSVEGNYEYYNLDLYRSSTESATEPQYLGPEPLRSVLRGMYHAAHKFSQNGTRGDMASFIFFGGEGEGLPWQRTGKLVEEWSYWLNVLDPASFESTTMLTTAAAHPSQPHMKSLITYPTASSNDSGLKPWMLLGLYPRAHWNTPLVNAIREAMRQLGSVADTELSIVLFTDGISTCHHALQPDGSRDATLTCSNDAPGLIASLTELQEIVESELSGTGVSLHMFMPSVSSKALYLNWNAQDPGSPTRCATDFEARRLLKDYVRQYEISDITQTDWIDQYKPNLFLREVGGTWYNFVRILGGVWSSHHFKIYDPSSLLYPPVNQPTSGKNASQSPCTDVYPFQCGTGVGGGGKGGGGTIGGLSPGDEQQDYKCMTVEDNITNFVNDIFSNDTNFQVVELPSNIFNLNTAGAPVDAGDYTFEGALATQAAMQAQAGQQAQAN